MWPRRSGGLTEKVGGPNKSLDVKYSICDDYETKIVLTFGTRGGLYIGNFFPKSLVHEMQHLLHTVGLPAPISLRRTRSGLHLFPQRGQRWQVRTFALDGDDQDSRQNQDSVDTGKIQSTEDKAKRTIGDLNALLGIDEVRIARGQFARGSSSKFPPRFSYFVVFSCYKT